MYSDICNWLLDINYFVLCFNNFINYFDFNFFFGGSSSTFVDGLV